MKIHSIGRNAHEFVKGAGRIVASIAAILTTVVVIAAVLVGIIFGTETTIRAVFPPKPEPTYTIACYNAFLDVTYVSIKPVLMANGYGIWVFADGTGGYIQQAGDTCIADEMK